VVREPQQMHVLKIQAGENLRRNMKSRFLILGLSLILLPFACFSPVVSGQSANSVPVNTTHAYTPYEKLILKNVSEFHKNFNNREWERNGLLVAEDLHVNSNGVEFTGRDAFVKRIARFAGPFPDVKLDDQVIIVDGNKAAIRFVITGTQKGDFQTPEGIIPASNRAIKIDGIEFFTFNEEGKLVDLLTVENLGLLVQQIKGKS
jgi:steroid delta-isomerase-like uncharacterized protein